MKVTREEGRVLIDLTVREAGRHGGFLEFATRLSMGWVDTHPVRKGEARLTEADGFSNARKMEALIEGLITDEEIEEAYG